MCDLFTTFLEKQRSIANHTWQSVVLDGELLEAVGGPIISTLGHGSKGQAPGGNQTNQGDYKNGMECKSAQRAFTAIDFILNGAYISNNLISKSFAKSLIRLDFNLIRPEIRMQLEEQYTKLHSSIQGDRAAIQIVERRPDGKYYGIPKLGHTPPNCSLFIVDRQRNPNGPLFWNKETGDYEAGQWSQMFSKESIKNSVKKLPARAKRGYTTMDINQLIDLLPEDPRLDDGTYIRISNELNLGLTCGEKFDFNFRQEDGHTNWEATREKQEAWFDSGGMILVNFYRDKFARVTMAVFRFNPQGSNRERFMEFWDGRQPHVNMRLFPNAERHRLKDDNWSYLTWDCELVALAVQQKNGFKSLHWKPDGGEDCRLSKKDIQDLIIKPKAMKNDCPVHSRIYDLDWNDERQRREFAGWFFEDCILGFFCKWIPIGDKNGITKNIGFGHLMEHLASLWFGMRGCKVRKGGDLYEMDGRESELKTCNGDKNDFLDTRHPRTNLMISSSIEKIQSWHRLFVGRSYCKAEKRWFGRTRGNLQIALFAPTQQTMSDLHHGLVEFYRENPTSPGKLQWQGRPFEQNYWQQDETRLGGILRLERIVEFTQYPQDADNKVRIVSEEIPEVVDCMCGICKAGGARWFPPPPSSSAMVAKNPQAIAWRQFRRIIIGQPEFEYYNEPSTPHFWPTFFS